jgi:hypothetical protein
MLEPALSSTAIADSSIATTTRTGAGHPYADLRMLAQRLADGLDHRAQSCKSISERRRLGILAAGASQICACLANTGSKL